jgi:choline dehydrogenase-like flavoprotein
MEATFDYLVVGAGSAGCALAGRLADSGNDSIALLEAGGHDHHVLVRTPPRALRCCHGPARATTDTGPFRRKGWTAGESASRVDAASAAHP